MKVRKNSEQRNVILKSDMYNEPKWQEPVEYISIGVALGVIFTIFIYGGYLL